MTTHYELEQQIARLEKERKLTEIAEQERKDRETAEQRRLQELDRQINDLRKQQAQTDLNNHRERASALLTQNDDAVNALLSFIGQAEKTGVFEIRRFNELLADVDRTFQAHGYAIAEALNAAGEIAQQDVTPDPVYGADFSTMRHRHEQLMNSYFPDRSAASSAFMAMMEAIASAAPDFKRFRQGLAVMVTGQFLAPADGVTRNSLRMQLAAEQRRARRNDF